MRQRCTAQHIAHHRIRGLQFRAGFGGHSNRFADLPDLQFDVHAITFRHFHRQRFHVRRPESYFLYRDAIIPRRHARKGVLAGPVGPLRHLAIGSLVLQCHRGIQDHRAARVVNRSHHRSCGD